MQDQQVELVDTDLPGALLEPVQRGVVAVVADPDLRLDEDLLARNPGATDAFADLTLIRVRGGSVDEPVAGCDGGFGRRYRFGRWGCGLGAGCEGGLHRRYRFGRWTLKDAEAKGGQLDAIVQRNAWDTADRGHGLLSVCLR